jgi:carbamoyl-phosphate synthase large subunit
MKYLITGCGGDIGLSICETLLSHDITQIILGSDIHNKHPQNLVYDECYLVPRADDSGYLSAILAIKADLIIPTSEAELEFFSNQFFENVVMVNNKAFVIGNDKLKTANFLKEHDLLFPETGEVKNSEPSKFPCIIKSRTGQGSKDVMMVDQELYRYYKKKNINYIWQELLLPGNEEYTCGVYRTKTNQIRTIIFKRELRGGLTGYAEVVENLEIRELLGNIAELLDLRGSINVQLILTERGPVVFEINPRFSSTVYFRHLLGFKDLIWTLEERDGQVSEYIPPKQPCKIFRGSREYIIKG